MSAPVIQVEGLTRRFGDFVAVDRISFTIQPGEIVGYLGPNGSGKTTTMRMLLGLLRPDEGQAQVLGYDIVRQAEAIRTRSGYMSQKFALYHDLTAGENLAFYAGVYGVRDPRRLREVLELAGLNGQEGQRVSGLAAGLRQRLALAVAIVHRPQLLFLDEPTSGVDPGSRRAFWELIYALVAEGVTALVSTHYMDEAEYCSRVGIMRAGRLLALDTPSALKAHAMPGAAWEITLATASAEDAPLLRALEALARCPQVLRAGLVSDRLRAITLPTATGGDLAAWLAAAGLPQPDLARVEPTLEDVFLALAESSE